MPKNSRPNSINTNYAVGYGRPPTSSRFAAGTSGNPRGRPRRKETPQIVSSQSELSMLHRAVLEAGATMVEVRRGDRRVKVPAHAAVVGGLIESAWQGNTRAADMFLRLHREAEELAQLQSVEDEQGAEFTKKIVRLIHTERATAHENEQLRARIAELEGAGARDVAEPKLTEEPAADSDQPSDVALPAAAQPAREPLTRSAPETVRMPPPIVHPKKAPHPPARRRRDDPLIASKGPVFGGGYGINGGRET
jgi:hypothetical protein